MAARGNAPRTTHTWLAPLYNYFDGYGRRQPIIGTSTGTVGFYGFTGIAKIANPGLYVVAASGLGASGFQATGIGNSGLYTHIAQAAWNGGSGTAYTVHDLVVQLKNMGILAQ